jgi:hypothetical protein
MKSDSRPKRANWTEGNTQIGVFVRTGMGGTIEFVNDNLDTPGAREEIRGILSPFLGEEWPEANREVPKVWVDEDDDEGPAYKWHVVVDTTVLAKYENRQQAEYTAEAIRKSFPFLPSPAPKPTASSPKKPLSVTTPPKKPPKKPLKCQECGKPAYASYWHPDGKTMEAMLCRKHQKIFLAESAAQVAHLRKRKQVKKVRAKLVKSRRTAG